MFLNLGLTKLFFIEENKLGNKEEKKRRSRV
jgi:hypothetical protein